MAIYLERAQISNRANGIPMFNWNPITRLTTQKSEKLIDGEQVHILERDYSTSITTFLRSSDGGRSWTWCQVHEILRTRKT